MTFNGTCNGFWKEKNTRRQRTRMKVRNTREERFWFFKNSSKNCIYSPCYNHSLSFTRGQSIRKEQLLLLLIFQISFSLSFDVVIVVCINFVSWNFANLSCWWLLLFCFPTQLPLLKSDWYHVDEWHAKDLLNIRYSLFLSTETSFMYYILHCDFWCWGKCTITT